MSVTTREYAAGLPVSACVAITRESLYAGLARPTLEAAGVGQIVEARGCGSAPAQWNAAIRAARCDLCLIAADDLYYAPDVFRRIVQAADEYPRASLFYGDHLLVGGRMGEPFIAANRCLPWEHSRFPQSNHIGMFAVRRSLVGDAPFDEAFLRYHDWELLWRLFDGGHLGVPLPGAWAVALTVGGCLSVPETEAQERGALFRKRGAAAP